MNNKATNKFTEFHNHMRSVLCYLVYEFRYGTRLKHKSDTIPKAVESVFRPANAHKTTINRSHGDATLTYGLDNHGKRYANLTIKGVITEIPDLPARKMAKVIDFYLTKAEEEK